MPPNTVICHPAQKSLFRTALSAVAGYSVTGFTAEIACKGKRHSADTVAGLRPIEVYDFDTVIGVIAPAVGQADVIVADSVLVSNNLQPGFWRPLNLPANSGMAVELVIRLPSVNKPWLDLQVVSWKPLHPHAVEKPRSIRRDVRWLISPIVEVVIAKETDVRYEYTGIDVEAVIDIEVVAAICLRHILVGTADVPLSHRGAGIVADRGGCKQSKQS